MTTLRYTNWMLTLIAACLIAIALQRSPLISTAIAQPATQPTPVIIVGSQLKQGIPVNLTGLGGHPNIPVAVVGQTGTLTVSAANPIPVTNASDTSALSVQIVKPQ